MPARDFASEYAYITTPRLRLTPVTDGDPVEVAARIGNYDVARWLGRVPYPYHKADAETFIAANADQAGRAWFIYDADGLVGGISIDDELGYWIAREAWGRGYATEAADWVVDAHFADPDAADLLSGHFPGNERSADVLRKLGFDYTGHRRVRSQALGQMVDGHELRLTRDAWRARREILITTPRLILRPLSPSDAADLSRIGGVPEVARMMINLTSPWSEEDILNWILIGRFRGRPGYRLGIARGPDFVGTVGIGRNLSVSYMLDPAHWGKGIITEAMTAFLTDVFRRFPAIDAVKADHFHDNPASGAVLGKLGFEETGTDLLRSRARPRP